MQIVRKSSARTTRAAFLIVALLNISFSLSPGLAPTPTLVLADDGHSGKYMGTGSCSSSNCHGSVAPRNGNDVLQNEYVTWQKHDKHAQAYAVLGNDESKIIAKHLGIKSPEHEPLCLKCHSTYVPSESKRGEKFTAEDGVSCETCHGAGENWLSTHTAKDATHRENVKNGMTDLTPVTERTKLCLGCHHGNDDKTVNHRLIGAGHPRLAFELDTFESIMPRHWDMDEDYAKRKFDYRPTSAWLTAQATQAMEGLDKILSKSRSSNGVFPEFTLFNCYACHHSLSGDQWKSRSYDGHPGEPQLNLASVQILREALKIVNPKLGTLLEAEIEKLHQDYKSGNGLDDVRSMRKLIAERILPNTSEDFGDAEMKRLLKQLTAFAANTPFLQYETAEQAAMGISAIASEIPSSAKLKNEIDSLYNSLRKEESFIPEDFTAAAQRLNSAASRL